MKRPKPFATALPLVCLVSAALAQQEQPTGATTKAPDATSAVAFLTTIAGNPVATETYTLTRDPETGRRVEAVIVAGGVEQRATTIVSKDGSFGFVVEVSGMKALSATLEGSSVELKVLGQADRKLETKATLILENLVWHQYVFLLDAYDAAKGGAQSFVAFLPTAATDFDFRLERTGPAAYDVNGKAVKTERYRIVSGSGLNMDLWTDETRTPLLFAVPSQHLKAVRKGYEALAEAAIGGAADAVKDKPPGYAKAGSFRERDIVVGSGDWTLPGTLTSPSSEGPHAAVVLVHGSGPNDRDETIGPNKPFRDIAWGLATQGIVVLRYDKRTKVHAAKMIAMMKDRLTVQEEAIDDALAAISFLRKSEGVDPRKIFVLGHSLGGMLAPRIAVQDGQVAGIVIMAGATRPLEDATIEQYRYIFSLDGTLSDTEKKELKRIEGQVAAVKDPQLSASTGAPELLLGLPAAYWLDLRAYRPAEWAKRVKQPILVLQGERDYQVTMEDCVGWKNALSSRKDVLFKTYPKLNHLFIEGEGKSTPEEYSRPGNVAQETIEDIAAWIRQR